MWYDVYVCYLPKTAYICTLFNGDMMYSMCFLLKIKSLYMFNSDLMYVVAIYWRWHIFVHCSSGIKSICLLSTEDNISLHANSDMMLCMISAEDSIPRYSMCYLLKITSLYKFNSDVYVCYLLKEAYFCTLFNGDKMYVLSTEDNISFYV